MRDLLSIKAQWDAIVVGAGPAGSTCAALLARRGCSLLLVEKSAWPRDKPCGGCVSRVAIDQLRQLGLSDVLRDSIALDSAVLQRGNDTIRLPLASAAMARSDLDRQLVDRAIADGATFLPSTSATLLSEIDGPFRSVQLRQREKSISVKANLVVIADGINGTALRGHRWAAWEIARKSCFGASCTIENHSIMSRGKIVMHIGRGGYVGLVRQPDGRLHVGAALDPTEARRMGGPQRHVEQILRENGVELRIAQAMRGTQLLTRRRRSPGTTRVLCIGDACSFVEPFTGEGIAWSLQSAAKLVSILPDHLRDWSPGLPESWSELHRATIGTRQRICRAVALTVRSPWLWNVASRVTNIAPQVAHWFADARTRALERTS